MKYFKDCRCAEDVKELFKTLAKKYHPDNNSADTTAVFQEMFSEYMQVFEQFKRTHRSASGQMYEQDTAETAEEYAGIIEALMRMTGCCVELIGKWLWVTGDTKTYKDQLKALGFKYASQKKAWCYHDGKYASHHSKASLSEIRAKYGSTSYDTSADKGALAG